MGVQRPLDLLNDFKGKSVFVHTKDGKVLRGKLMAFDIHINIALEKTEELDEDGESIKLYGDSFIRGESIKYITPKDKE